MATSKSTKSAGGKPTDIETFDGDAPAKVSGGADPTPMVGFKANVRISGGEIFDAELGHSVPVYVVEAGETELIPKEYAEAHAADGHGGIVA